MQKTKIKIKKDFGNNEFVPMTRRFHAHLPQKVLKRDAKIAGRIVWAWDVEHDQQKVLQIFLKEQNNLSPERYWELLRTVWIVCGSLETIDVFRKLFTANKRSRYCFSTPEEAAQLRDLPQFFDAYRACNSENDGGISWTLSKEYAEWYKEAYKKEMIISRVVCKNDVFALINRNNEHEIIML